MDKINTEIGLVQDTRGLDQLRKLSNQDDASQQQALEAAARQFESIFNQMWVGSMRETNESLAPDSPLNSRYSKFFQGMLDEQMPNRQKKVLVGQIGLVACRHLQITLQTQLAMTRFGVSAAEVCHLAAVSLQKLARRSSTACTA